MPKKHYLGSCHCKAVRYEVDLDLAKGTNRCNCSICWKARAWFAFAGGNDFKLLTSLDEMSAYQWTPPGHPGPGLTYRFCKHCGIRIYATGEHESMGGRFYALHVPTLDDVAIDELAVAPLRFRDNLHDKADREPQDTRLL